jgi:hypothetical protein
MHRFAVSAVLVGALVALAGGCTSHQSAGAGAPAPAAGAARGAVSVAAQIRPQLAARLGVPPDALRLVVEEAVRWSDSSLGCPKPGMMYTQVITPGWRLGFAGRDGRTHEVHANRDGSHWVLCSRAARTAVPEEH